MVVREIQSLTGMTGKEIERRWRGDEEGMISFLEVLKNPVEYRPSLSAAQSELILGNSLEVLKTFEDCSIDSIISDIPYGIDHDDWDVLHANKNTALLGASAAQDGSKTFAKRRKPINGWSEDDRDIPAQYQEWCSTWAEEWLRVLKPGSSALVFAGRRFAHRCTVALEDAGFNVKDILTWEKHSAPFRAQRVAIPLRKRGLLSEADYYGDWRLGNLAPVAEPILWFQKPYDKTVIDCVLEHGNGAINSEAFHNVTESYGNIIKIGHSKQDSGSHSCQKPVKLMEALVALVVPDGGIVLDPFAGSGTTGIAARDLGKKYIMIENHPEYYQAMVDRFNNSP